MTISNNQVSAVKGFSFGSGLGGFTNSFASRNIYSRDGNILNSSSGRGAILKSSTTSFSGFFPSFCEINNITATNFQLDCEFSLTATGETTIIGSLDGLSLITIDNTNDNTRTRYLQSSGKKNRIVSK